MQGELRPDYTMLLDVSVAIGMGRASGRGNLDRIEQETLEFFERVRLSYLQQAKNSSGRYRLIDASGTLDEVQQELIEFGSELVSCWVARRSNSDGTE